MPRRRPIEGGQGRTRVVDREKLIETLRRVADRYQQIKLMYLFGSYAEGRAVPASDIDIAVVAVKPSVIPHVMAGVAKELQIPEEKISVLDLEYASSALVASILKRGIKIVDREGTEQRLLERIAPETLELNELSEIHFRKWVEGDPLDPRVMNRIIAQIQEDVQDLEQCLSRGLEAVVRDKTLRKAFERTLQTLIEGCIDLLRHIVSGLSLGVAEFYRDYVEIAKRSGAISEETAERLLELIPVRHALVHRYRDVDYTKLWRGAQAIIEAGSKLLEEVRRYLKTLEHA